MLQKYVTGRNRTYARHSLVQAVIAVDTPWPLGDHDALFSSLPCDYIFLTLYRGFTLFYLYQSTLFSIYVHLLWVEVIWLIPHRTGLIFVVYNIFSHHASHYSYTLAASMHACTSLLYNAAIPLRNILFYWEEFIAMEFL